MAVDTAKMLFSRDAIVAIHWAKDEPYLRVRQKALDLAAAGGGSW